MQHIIMSIMVFPMFASIMPYAQSLIRLSSNINFTAFLFTSTFILVVHKLGEMYHETRI